MKTVLEVISPVKKKLVVEVEPEEVDKKVEETYKNIGRNAKVDGFRPGKIPRRILERHYGAQVAEEVAKELVRETLPKAIDETKTFPLSLPVVENEVLKGGQAFKYTALMEVKPEFELKDYMGLDVEKETVRIGEEEVGKQLEEIRKSNGKLVPVEEDRGIREGDYAVVRYSASENGKQAGDLKADNFPVRVGSNEFHPELEKALLGHKTGDAVRAEVQFPEGVPNPRLAGKRLDFHMEVLGVKELQVPPLDDDFARNLGADFEDLEALKKKIREELTSSEEKRVEREVKKRLLKKISDKVDFELPESLIEEEIDYGIGTLKQNLSRMGSSLDKAGLNQDKLREEFRPGAERRVKELLVLGEIARQNDLRMEESEIEEGFVQIAEGMKQDPLVVKRYYEANRLTDSFRQRLLEEKTLNFLVKGANLRVIEADRMDKQENPSEAAGTD